MSLQYATHPVPAMDAFDGKTRPDDLLCIRAITLSWLDGKRRNRWLKRLTHKAGRIWLLDEDEQQDAWSWVLRAPVGDTLHRHEGLWFVLNARVGNKVLLANYEDQCFEALRISAVDLHSMD